MEQTFDQTQQQVQVMRQQMVAAQVYLSKLLELPIAELRERVQTEMDSNEALEEGVREGGGESKDVSFDEEVATSDEGNDYRTPDDIPDYLLRQQGAVERVEMQISDRGTSYDDLYRQVGELELTDHEREVAEYLVGSLDGDGYLRRDLTLLADEMSFRQNIETTPEELERILGLIQTFEPHGIGARNLRECLRLQLADDELQSPYKEAALRMLDTCYEEFALRHFNVVRRRLKLSEEDFEGVMQLIKRLNPKPGGSLGEAATAAAPTVVPDFYVYADGDMLGVGLNNADLPELRVSRSFRDTLNEYGKAGLKLSRQQREELIYARNKVNNAQYFIDMLQRRQETLLSVMQAIVEIQREFFLEEDDETRLVPMTLKDVQARCGVELSGISRAASSKYVQTDYGIYPLSFFFSSKFTSSDGEDISQREAQAALREVIDAEDKHRPLSDEALTALMSQKGFPISRRTIAKYRDVMGIPTSRMRRQK